MRERQRWALLLPLSLARITAAAAATLLTACGSMNADLVEGVCECEHCDDWREQELLAALDSQAGVADAYGCDADFEALVQCQIDEGQCDDTEAKWNLSKPDKCGTAVPCTMDADCAMIGSTCGISGKCNSMVCDGDPTKGCTTDKDCPGGKGRCDTEQTDLNDCIHDASEHDGPGFGG